MSPSENTPRRRIPGFIRNDFSRKLSACILALILCFWVRVYMQPEETVTLTGVKVRINVPKNEFTVVKTRGDLSVSVRLRCSKARARIISGENFEVVAHPSLADYEKGRETRLVLTGKNVKPPLWGWGLRNIEIPQHQKDIFVTLSRIETREIKVQPYFFPDKPEKGWMCEKWAVTPAKIRVTAPDHVLDKLKTVSTKAIPLTGKKLSFELKKVEIDLAKLPEQTSVERNSVVVSVTIAPEITSREEQDIPVSLMSGENRLKAQFKSSNHVTILFEGPREAVGKLKKSEIKPYVDVSRKKSGTCSLKVECNLPGSLRVKEIKPSEVKVELRP